MLPAVEIDEIDYVYKDATAHTNEAGYFVTAYFKDAEAYTAYYRIIGYKDEIPFTDANSYVITSDFSFAGKETSIECGFNYSNGEIARIELLTCNYDTYLYYNSLDRQQSAGSGNDFALPPDNIIGNFSNGALGFFAAVGISEASIQIQQ